MVSSSIKTPKVLVASEEIFGPATPYAGMLKDAGFEVCFPEKATFLAGLISAAEQAKELHGCAAVIAWGEPYPGSLLDRLPDLRVIARAGVGFDKVDIAAATEAGIVVTITPTANFEAVAEHTFALMLAVARNVSKNDREMRAGRYPHHANVSLREKTLGIIGLGRIGRAVALRAKAMRMTVIAYESYPDFEFIREHAIELVELEHLLSVSDFVSLHCPLNEQTQGLMNQARLSKMKPTAILINTARGGLVVEEDLVEALNKETIRGAGLDVFEEEPTDPANPMFELDNIVVTPHEAGVDELSIEKTGLEAARNIIDLREGRWPDQAVVNGDLKGKWTW